MFSYSSTRFIIICLGFLTLNFEIMGTDSGKDFSSSISFFLNQDGKPTAVYHAFDLPLCRAPRDKGLKTFRGADMTPILDRLDHIERQGYSHIQLSPIQQCRATGPQPNFSEHQGDHWYLPYQPYLCVLDDTYKSSLEKVLGKTVELKDYGVLASDGKTIVGYQLGNIRYGSIEDLKTLIDQATKRGIKIIVDGVFNHACFAQADDHGITHPVSYDPTSQSLTLERSVTFPEDFFWESGCDWGPNLRKGTPAVVEMIVKCMKLLREMGVDGLRIDSVRNMGLQETKEILAKAKKEMGESSPRLGFFNCGYGEFFHHNAGEMKDFAAVFNLEDYPLNSLIERCFASDMPVSSLIGNYPLNNPMATTFSVSHDQYPGVGHWIMKYYGDGDRNKSFNVVRSQLATAFLATGVYGFPRVIRLEDEKDDISGLIGRSIRFRKHMEQKGSKEDFMKALDSNVLIVGRKYGFAIINKGENAYTVNDSSIQDQKLRNFIPDGVYFDSNGARYSVPGLNVGVFGRNAVFLELASASPAPVNVSTAGPAPTSVSTSSHNAVSTALSCVTFKINVPAQIYRNKGVYVVGNVPSLGAWDPKNAVEMKRGGDSLWQVVVSLPFTQDIEYKYVLKTKDAGEASWMLGDNLKLLTNSAGSNSSQKLGPRIIEF